MKKLVFMFVAMAAISFASCGNENKGDNKDSVKDSVDTMLVTDTTDTTATPADTAATPADTTVKA